MPIYYGSQKIKPSGIKNVYYGSTNVYKASRLPDAYQEVEYIQSSGTQYLNLNRTLNQTNKVELDFQYLSIGTLNGSRGAIFGDYGGVGFAANPNQRTSSYNGRMVFWRGSNNQFVDIGGQGDKFIQRGNLVMDAPNNIYSWLGFSCNLPAAIGNTTGCWLLTVRDGDGVTFYTTPIGVKIYSCKIYTSGALSNDYIPCYRIADGVIGLYDLINDVFYTNQGTGTFTKGPDV